MGLLQIATVTLAVLGSALGAQYCDATSKLCYNEYKSPGNVYYRVAIPAVTAAPFDVAFQIVAPKAAGWAGIAWGGSMLNNPIAVAWPNGNTVTVSSRMASSYSMPQPYAGASYTVRSGTTVNATHWTLDALCKGCSQWAAGKIDPSATAGRLAWAMSASPVGTPASNTSNFGYHQQKSSFTLDLKVAQQPNFANLTAPPAPATTAPAAAPA